MPTQIELQRSLLEERKKLSAQRLALSAATREKTAVDRALRLIDKTPGPGAAAKKAALQGKAAALAKTIDEAKQRVQTILDEIARLEGLIGPRPAERDAYFDVSRGVSELDDGVPILLFPVRLETRFHAGKAGAPNELWIRVYPDTCQTAIPRSYLTPSELQSAVAFLDDPKHDLVARHGRPRASFLQIWVDKHRGTAGFAAALKRGDAALLKNTFGVALVEQIPPPVASTLPDRFVFRLHSRDGKKVRNEVGEPVAPTLLLGIDQSQGDNGALDWLHDFGKAVAAGMGIKVRLSAEEYEEGFSRLVVAGVKAASDPATSQGLLESLFDDHFHSHDGFELIRQGVPTNNSDQDSAGYSTRGDPAGAEPFPAPRPETIRSNTEQQSLSLNDGHWLSQYLGVDDGLFQKVDGGKGLDQAEARAMNAALFPATVGYFLEEMLDPLLDPEDVEGVERFFTAYVLGRGPLPSVRIGNQPYGILPVSVLRRLDLGGASAVRREIAARVDTLFDLWRRKARTLPHIDGSAPISNEDFLRILSLHPTSVQFGQRLLEDVGPRLNAVRSVLPAGLFGDLNDWIEHVHLPAAFDAEKLAAAGLDGAADRPGILHKLFDEKVVPLKGPVIERPQDEPGLALKETLSETDGLRHNYIQWLADGDVETIRTEKGLQAGPKPLLFLFLKHAYLTRFAGTALRLKEASSSGQADDVLGRYRDSQDVESKSTSKMALLYQPDAAITQSATLSVKDFLHQKLMDSAAPASAEIAALRQHRAALSGLAGLPTARLERAFVEHLDCCTYRIDAWINGLFSAQLRRQRLASARGSRWSKGIYLGSFGYVENLKRKGASTSEGYILAPSLSHAATGAILKNAQLTYAGNAPNPFDIDISSERVRTAARLLEGVRNGQGLPELLGYRFERQLHEEQLEKHILDFRKKYPLSRMSEAPAAGRASEAIAAANVTNGLSLLADYQRRGAAIFGSLGATTDGEKTLLAAALDRLASLFDATKDLLMAEGVFQAVQGNHERGAAVMDAPGRGKAIPEIEVLRTPRNGPILTHRFALHLDRVKLAPGAKSSRAMLEPSVNAWLKTVLPAPESVVAGVRFSEAGAIRYVSVKDLAIEPIDLLYLLDGSDERAMSALDDLVVAHLSDRHPADLSAYLALKRETLGFPLVSYALKGDASQFSFFEIGALLGPLRTCLLQSRPLTPGDLTNDTDGAAGPANSVSAHHGQRIRAVIQAIEQLDSTFADSLDDAPLAQLRSELVKLFLAARPLLWMETSFGRILEDVFYPGDDPAELARIRSEIGSVVGAVKRRAEVLVAGLGKLLEELDPQQPFRVFHERLKEVCGDDVLVLPDLALPVGATPQETASIAQGLQDALQKSPALLKLAKEKLGMDFPVEEWMAGVARVRDKMAAALEIHQFVETHRGEGLTLTPIQLPPNASDRWLAVQFALEGEEIAIGDSLLYTFAGPGQNGLDKGLCGLVLDEWTEVIPGKKETAGLSFHHNRPNAEAPQTMLLCTPPELTGRWDLEDVFDSITEAFELAKARAVEPDHLDDTVLAQLLPATILFCPLYDTSISTNLLQNLDQG